MSFFKKSMFFAKNFIFSMILFLSISTFLIHCMEEVRRDNDGIVCYLNLLISYTSPDCINGDMAIQNAAEKVVKSLWESNQEVIFNEIKDEIEDKVYCGNSINATMPKRAALSALGKYIMYKTDNDTDRDSRGSLRTVLNTALHEKQIEVYRDLYNRDQLLRDSNIYINLATFIGLGLGAAYLGYSYGAFGRNTLQEVGKNFIGSIGSKKMFVIGGTLLGLRWYKMWRLIKVRNVLDKTRKDANNKIGLNLKKNISGYAKEMTQEKGSKKYYLPNSAYTHFNNDFKIINPDQSDTKNLFSLPRRSLYQRVKDALSVVFWLRLDMFSKKDT